MFSGAFSHTEKNILVNCAEILPDVGTWGNAVASHHTVVLSSKNLMIRLDSKRLNLDAILVFLKRLRITQDAASLMTLACLPMDDHVYDTFTAWCKMEHLQIMVQFDVICV